MRKRSHNGTPTPSPLTRYMDAMLVSREFKAGTSDMAKRVTETDKRRLVRDAYGKLKL